MDRRRASLAIALLAGALIGGCGWLRRDRAGAPPERIDLNRAALRRVEKLPGITPSLAHRVVDGRPYGDPHELVERGILTEREFRRIEDRVTVKQ